MLDRNLKPPTHGSVFLFDEELHGLLLHFSFVFYISPYSVDLHCAENASIIYRNYMFTICSVGFFVPLIIIIFCYSRILHVMYSADSKLHRLRSGLPQPRLAKFSKTRRRNYTLKNIIPKRRVTVLVANLIISFVICWLPFHSWVSFGSIFGSQCFSI